MLGVFTLYLATLEASKKALAPFVGNTLSVLTSMPPIYVLTIYEKFGCPVWLLENEYLSGLSLGE
jgi:hypothetical protein